MPDSRPPRRLRSLQPRYRWTVRSKWCNCGGSAPASGGALACRCSHITLPDHSEAILVVATGRAGPDLSLDERVSRLLAGNDQPVAAFTADGKLIDATPAAASFLRGKQSLAALEIAAMAAEAARTGHAEGSAAHCSVRIDRIGGGPATVLLAAFSELSETEKLVAAAAETSGTSSTAVDEPAASDPAVSDVLPADAVEAAAAEIAAAANAIDAAVPTVPEPVEAAPQEIAPREPIAMAAPEPGVVTPAAEPVAGAADEPEATAAPTPAIAATLDPMLPSAAEPPLQSAERRHPLRFVWQIDAEGRFTLESEEFVALVGPATAHALGRPWPEIANELGLDPEQRILQALATHDTWSGLTVSWPVDGAPDRLMVELSGLPAFDRGRQFRGYRGFGVCRDIARLNAVALMRDPSGHAPADPAPVAAPAENDLSPPATAPGGEADAPTLSSVEHHAFYELSRRLTHHLNNDEALDLVVAQSDSLLSPAGDMRQLFDRLPVGVLIYRLEQLIYANRAFLQATGHDSLDELIEAGGLDSLLMTPDSASFEAAPGKPFALTIITRDHRDRIEVELIPVLWENEAAHALLIQSPAEPAQAQAAQIHGIAELQAVLDTATDGIVVLDRAGSILSANRRAEALFGYDARELSGRPFLELFAPESVDVVTTYLDSVRESSIESR